MDTLALIKQKLAALCPEKIEVLDESSRHAGHEGAKSGGGHYCLTIVSREFSGKPAITRHRMVYAALGEMMRKDIHALSVKAYTPDEI